MNWDRIETSWAAMTRRVRPDWPEVVSASDPAPLELDDATGAMPAAPEETERTAPRERVRAALPIE